MIAFTNYTSIQPVAYVGDLSSQFIGPSSSGRTTVREQRHLGCDKCRGLEQIHHSLLSKSAATAHAAEVMASKTLRNAEVAARLAELRAEQAKRHEVTIDSLAREFDPGVR
jgi:hypothetical protein